MKVYALYNEDESNGFPALYLSEASAFEDARAYEANTGQTYEVVVLDVNTQTPTTDEAEITFFATDGSYGDAVGLEIIDTTNWTDEQTIEVIQAHPDERQGMASRSVRWRAMAR